MISFIGRKYVESKKYDNLMNITKRSRCCYREQTSDYQLEMRGIIEVQAKSLQSHPTHQSMDCSPPGSSVHRILQVRILEWIASPSSRDLSDPEKEPVSLESSALVGGFFTTSTT